MNEEEKEIIELDIEAKYANKTEKEFLSRVTYAECLYILKPENKYCDKIRELSLLKLCEIIGKLQKENEELKEYIAIAPNLDEMTALKYRNIQKDAYVQGRAEEKQKAEQIIYKNYISKQRLKEKIEELREQDKEWTEELSEPDSNFKVINRHLKRIKNQIDVLQELLEGRK